MTAIGTTLSFCVAHFINPSFGVMLHEARLKLARTAALLLLSVGQANRLLLNTWFHTWYFITFTTWLKGKEVLVRPF